MIKNDFRYIIKKIIIGIGIIFGISFIRSCNVNAADLNSQYQYIDDKGYMLVSTNYSAGGCSGCYYNYLFYNDVNNSVDLYFRSYNKTPDSSLNLDDYPYFVADTSTATINVIGCDKEFHNISYGITKNSLETQIGGTCAFKNIGSGSSQTDTLNTFNYPTANNRQNFDYNDNTLQKNVDTNQLPKIISLNPTYNENDGVLLSVTLSPEFSFIDTNNYNYYAWFKGYDKLSILENNPVFNINYNTTFYVQITDKQGNNIDAQTFTVSRIGQYDVSEYQILFSYETYTESDTTNNPKPVDYIDRVDIDTTFLPKSPYLKYQYQFVNEGDSLTDDWLTVNPDNSSDLSKNNFVFVTHDNGTLYAKIVDLNGNYLYGATFTLDNIGSVKYYANDTNVGGFFDKIIDKLDYSGPISSLIAVPIRLFSSLLTESSKSCTPYNFGVLLGSQITFSCVNIENYIGSNLYHLLDLLMSFGLALGIIHFIKKQYHKFTTLNENSDDIM